MPPEDDPPTGEPEGDPIDAAIADADPTPPSTTLSATDVRRSPEYRALAAKNRELARTNGQLTTAEAAARTAAEEARLAAEAGQQAALDAQLIQQLGTDGMAFWDEFAALSASDPVAAAKRLAEFRAAGAVAQNDDPDADPAAGDPDAGGGTVPAQTPPPPSRGVDGGAPLGAASTGEDMNAVIAGLEKGYSDVVERVQNPATRNRVTMKDRSAAFINYLAASLLKSGATPKNQAPPRS